MTVSTSTPIKKNDLIFLLLNLIYVTANFFPYFFLCKVTIYTFFSRLWYIYIYKIATIFSICYLNNNWRA